MLDVSSRFFRRARFAATLRRVLAWPARVAEARRNFALLAQMSDRELSDIGLLRSDLFDCAALPPDEDPTRRLAAVRAARAWFAPKRGERAGDRLDGPPEPAPVRRGTADRQDRTGLVRA